jgi:hypothetical protein
MPFVSDWIFVPEAASMIRGRPGVEDSETEILLALRDGALQAQGILDTPDGPQAITLGREWWINLEYRWGPNMVWWRNNDAIIYKTLEGRQISLPPAIKLPEGLEAREVRVRRSDVERLWPVGGSREPAGDPPPITSLGRPRGSTKYDWVAFHAEIAIRMANSLDGFPEVQADLEREMAEWCAAEWGEEPSESVIREQVGRYYR